MLKAVPRKGNNSRRIIRELDTRHHKALDGLARLGVNASKDKNRANTWTDRTGNLRSSIDHVVEELHSSDARRRALQAVVFAAMEYAPHVHFRANYKVLVPPNRRLANFLL